MMPTPFDRQSIPRRPGVYIFRDVAGKVLYVGKAIDLYSRVSSYFSASHISSGNVKTGGLIEEINSCQTIEVESELEALILEANLIKKYLPKFNVRLTDDKDYLYIKVTKEPFPRIITARKKDLYGVKRYFGPFPSGNVVRGTLKKLRRIFPWCSSPPKTKLRPCFYYHLGLCLGPCAGKIDRKEYCKIISHFTKFMQGKKDGLATALSTQMEKASQKMEYETAAQLKKMVEGIAYLTQSNKASLYLQNPNFLEDQRQLSLVLLKKDLNLAKLPRRIEAYDISNIQGEYATGSMVVLTDGDIDKSQYRKFKIKIFGKPDDVAMHQEMIRRRLKHPEWPLPDLIIIDGGMGQVRAAKAEIRNLGLAIPVFGLAKRMEWLYPPEGEVKRLPKSSLSLRLLQKLRDEAHRFALTYHRYLRNKYLLHAE